MHIWDDEPEDHNQPNGLLWFAVWLGLLAFAVFGAQALDLITGRI